MQRLTKLSGRAGGLLEKAGVKHYAEHFTKGEQNGKEDFGSRAAFEDARAGSREAEQSAYLDHELPPEERHDGFRDGVHPSERSLLSERHRTNALLEKLLTLPRLITPPVAPKALLEQKWLEVASLLRDTLGIEV